MLVPTINEAHRSYPQLQKLSQGATIRKFRLVRTRAQLRRVWGSYSTRPRMANPAFRFVCGGHRMAEPDAAG